MFTTALSTVVDDVSSITRVYNTRCFERKPLVNSRRIRRARRKEGEKRVERSNRGTEFASHGQFYFKRNDGGARSTILIRRLENVSRDSRKKSRSLSRSTAIGNELITRVWSGLTFSLRTITIIKNIILVEYFSILLTHIGLILLKVYFERA